MSKDHDLLILVNEQDEVLGNMPKMEVHQKGLLHRAFSVCIFNEKGEMLLQQRAEEKYHSAGLWTNTCCSHPLRGEDTLQAAISRLEEEMGISAKLEWLFSFVYRTEFENGLVENELDHVFMGYINSTIIPNPNPEEVKTWKWVNENDLLEEMNHHPQRFTYWFRMIAEKVIAVHKAEKR